MIYDYIGIVHEIQGVINPDTFPKRNLIIKNITDYGERFATFTAFKDKTTLLDQVTAGEHVRVKFVVEGARQGWSGRDGNLKYFTDLKVISVEKIAGANPPAAPTAPAPVAPAAPVHVLGGTMQAAVMEWSAWKGEDKEGFKAFCMSHVVGADGKPKASTTYTAADWGVVINAIRDEKAGSVTTCDQLDDAGLGW